MSVQFHTSTDYNMRTESLAPTSQEAGSPKSQYGHSGKKKYSCEISGSHGSEY
jgi:hypothetical protein